MRRISIKTKVLTALSLFFILSIGIGSALLINSYRNRVEGLLSSKLEGLSSMFMNNIEELLSYGLSLQEMKDMDVSLKQLVDSNTELKRSGILNEKGVFLYNSNKELEGKTFRSLTGLSLDKLKTKNIEKVKHVKNGSVLYSINTPIFSEDNIFIGAFRIGASTQFLDKDIKEMQIKVILFGLSVIVTLVLITFVTISHLIIKPLKIFTKAFETPDGRVHITTNDEFEDVAQKYNKTADALSKTTVSRDALQRANENTKIILEKAPFGVVVIGKDRRIRWANQSVVRMAGVKNKDILLGRNCGEYLCPAEQNECPILDKNQQVDDSERTLRRHDGTTIPIIKTVREINFGNEDVLLETFIDISDRKKAENKLQESILVAKNSELISYNMMEDAQNAKESAEKSSEDFETASKKLQKALDKTKNSERIAMSMMDDANVARKKAEKVQEELQLSLGLSESLREDLDKTKEKAEAAAKAKADFLANMSHEIRTPMNAILGFSDLLKKTELDEKQENYLNTVTSSGQLLIGIINDILDFSKIEAGKITLEAIDFNLKYMINDVFKMLVSRMKDKPFDTYIDIESDVPLNLKGDPTRLRQILVNLLSNAMKFTSDGSIGVIVRKEEGEGGTDQAPMLRITVKDTGIGIPKDKVETIFESFTQADETTTRKFGGTGLGLSISKAFVNAMRGNIWAESEEGKGSEFIFTVKLALGEVASEKEVFPLKKGELRGRKVLIVDDNEISRKIHTKCCESMEMEILSIEDSAHSALDRLNKLQSEGNIPELILCDIMMEGMNGYELAEKIRADEKLKGIKMIAVTSDPRIGEANTAGEKGFDGYLPKPVILEELAKVIKTVLGDKRTERTIVTRHMAEELSCKGVMVLIVEDSMPNQMLIQAYFSELGCEGDLANNGQEAVDKLKIDCDKYDLVLMDMQMPVMGGLDATKIIRNEISKDIPIIALTAAVMEEDRKNAHEAGMNEFLAKPVDIVKLKEVILKYRG